MNKLNLEKFLEPIIGSSIPECLALYNAVKNLSHLEGEIVEIGCLYGRTSIAICQAAKDINQKSVHIDYLFQYPDLETCRLGGYEQYPSNSNIEEAFKKNTYLEFTRNFIKADLFDNAIICASKSSSVRDIWTKDIKFIMIDADHSYDGVKADWDMFEPFVVSGGIIALHDVDLQGHPGVFQFFQEIMATNKYEQIRNHSGIGTSLQLIRKK